MQRRIGGCCSDLLGSGASGQDAPLDLDRAPRRRRLSLTVPAARSRSSSGELIAIDRKFAVQPVAVIDARLQQRPEQSADCRGSEESEQELEQER